MGKEIREISITETEVTDEQFRTRLEHNLGISLKITQSLLRCAHHARKNSTGSQDGLKRALEAARERIEKI